MLASGQGTAADVADRRNMDRKIQHGKAFRQP